MSKYKINKERILEILREYDESFKIIGDELYLEYNGFSFILTDYKIEHIKKGFVDPECAFFDNMIIEKLHEYFDECFEEKKPKYSYEKCKEFLEDNGFIVHENIVACKCIDNQNETVLVTDCFDYILDKLEGDDTFDSYKVEQVIATILHANKDKLSEEW